MFPVVAGFGDLELFSSYGIESGLSLGTVACGANMLESVDLLLAHLS